MTAPLALDLDRVVCDTRPLWADWLASAGPVLGIPAEALPEDRGAAAAELDRLGAGNWRTLLERWSEDRAAVYLRRDARTSSTLRALAAAGRRIGVFTDAPEALARIALSHVGAARRVADVEAGASAKERLLRRLGDGAIVIESRDELLQVTP